jgi:chromosome partitioning protein
MRLLQGSISLVNSLGENRHHYSRIFLLMVIATPLHDRNTTAKSSVTTKQLVEIWSSLPNDYPEAELDRHLVSKIFEHLGYDRHQVKNQHNIGIAAALKPDYLIYNDPSKPPVLVVEIKKREPALATVNDPNFVTACENQSLYRDAVGLTNNPRNNGILQYLDITKVKPECLASYGLVFNGDFFQLWRRVDGLIIPMTTIKRVTKTSLPKLLKELTKCLQAPPSALVTAIWNSKGGVAKTTNTINITACLALVGKRVLLIDLDPQNDLTTGIGLKANFSPDYFDRVYDKLQLQELDSAKEIITAAIQSKTYTTTDGQSFQLSLLSSDREHLNKINNTTTYKHQPYEIFNKTINLIRHNYDYIFIDSSPKYDKLTDCLLYTVEAIIIPIDIGGKSLKHAIDLSQKEITRIQFERNNKAADFTAGPWNLGLVFSNCPNDIGSGINQEIIKTIDTNVFTGKRIEVRLKNYDRTSLAEFQEKPVVCWQKSRITKLFHNLTNEVFLGHNYANK